MSNSRQKMVRILTKEAEKEAKILGFSHWHVERGSKHFRFVFRYKGQKRAVTLNSAPKGGEQNAIDWLQKNLRDAVKDIRQAKKRRIAS